MPEQGHTPHHCTIAAPPLQARELNGDFVSLVHKNDFSNYMSENSFLSVDLHNPHID